MKRKVIFYRNAAGKCPVRDFLDSLPSQAAQKVTWVLRLVEDFDIVPASYFKKLAGTEGLWEFRIKSGANIYRIFCFFFGEFNRCADARFHQEDPKDTSVRDRKGRILSEGLSGKE
jgi:hypothetical protein